MTTAPIYANFPPLDLLPANVRTLAEEHLDLVRRRDAADDDVARLTEPSTLAVAEDADAVDNAQAIRDGAAITTANVDAWRKALEDARTLAAGLDGALAAVQAELVAAFGEMVVDDKASGRAALDAATEKVRKAAAALVDAHVVAAALVPYARFVYAAAHAWPGQPARWTGDNHQTPTIGLESLVLEAGVRGASRFTPDELVALLVADVSTDRLVAGR